MKNTIFIIMLAFLFSCGNEKPKTKENFDVEIKMAENQAKKDSVKKYYQIINDSINKYNQTIRNDYIDFNTRMKPHEQFMYTTVLQKLIFLDSLQGRGILLTLGQICTLPELENAMLTWEYFEGAKHSKTYTENLKGVYNNPSEIFDESFEIPELMKLASSISEPYNIAYELIIEMQYNIIKNNIITPEFLIVPNGLRIS